MPGIAGYVLEPQRKAGYLSIQQLLYSLRHFDDYTSASLWYENFAAGSVDLVSNPLHLCQDRSGNTAVAIGEVYNDPQATPGLTNLARFFLEEYLKSGQSIFAQVDGKFACVIWDQAARKLILAGDCWGQYPMYYCLRDGTLVFSCEQKTILQFFRQTGMRCDFPLNEQALLEYMVFGYNFNEGTLLKDISLLPAGGLLIYQDGRLEVEKYYDLTFDHLTGQEDIGREHYRVLSQSIARRVPRDDESLIVALSGGLDSRTVAAELHHLERSFRTVSFGYPGCADAVLGAEIARRLGVENDFIPLDLNVIREYANEAVYLLEGMVRVRQTHHSYQMVRNYPLSRSSVWMFGFLGGTSHDGGTGDSKPFGAKLEDVKTQQDFVKYIFERERRGLRLSEIPIAFSQGFGSGDPALLYKGLGEKMHSIFERANSEDFQRQYYYFKLTQRNRRWIMWDCVVSSRFFCKETRSPYTDRDLIDFSISLPPEEYRGKRCYIHTIVTAYPQLADVPYAKTMIRLNATQREKDFARYKLLLQRLARKAVERLSIGRLSTNVPWFLFTYDRWLRAELKPWIQGILLDPRTLNRGIIEPKFIRQVMDEHMTGQADRSDLLLTMATFELWQRMFFDQDTSVLPDLPSTRHRFEEPLIV